MVVLGLAVRFKLEGFGGRGGLWVGADCLLGVGLETLLGIKASGDSYNGVHVEGVFL